MDESVRRRRKDELANSDADEREQQKDAELVARSSQGWNVFFLAFAVAGVVVSGVVYLLPSPIEPVAFSLPPPPEWTGALTPNTILTLADRVFENKLRGPESFVRDWDYIYAGTSDGKIVSIYKGTVTTLARLSNTKRKDCGSHDAEPVCGRPLGMRLDKDGYLLVADAYLGIFRVNVATGSVHEVLSSKHPMAGKVPKLLNDVQEGKDGIIYFTDSSTKWDRRHNRYCILEGDASGRLLSYDPDTMHLEELVGGVAFANGLVISSDDTHILFAETTKARILRYHLTGDMKGQTDVFADNLPGLPDNIRASGRGTYWVGLAAIRRAGKFSMLDTLAPYPWIRALIFKLISQEAMMSMIPQYGLLLEFDKEGNIIRSLHDPSGKQVPSISEADEHDGILYLGSYYLPYLSRVSLNKKYE